VLNDEPLQSPRQKVETLTANYPISVRLDERSKFGDGVQAKARRREASRGAAIQNSTVWGLAGDGQEKAEGEGRNGRPPSGGRGGGT
jgi:hypothetical protein